MLRILCLPELKALHSKTPKPKKTKKGETKKPTNQKKYNVLMNVTKIGSLGLENFGYSWLFFLISWFFKRF